MANMALLEAARSVNKPQWRTVALDRLWRDFREVYADCGVHGEQASGYLLHNLGLWERATAAFSTSGQRGRAAYVTEVLNVARAAIAQLTAPGGELPMIGDSHRENGKRPKGEIDERLWCPDEGWAAARDSWANPSVHYTVRFGPTPNLHGHDDHGSLTWWTDVAGGATVFEDPGSPHRDQGSAAVEKASSKSFHNVLEPVGVEFAVKSSASREIRTKTDEYVIRDAHRKSGTERTRTVQFDMERPRLVVKDAARSDSTRVWKQHWHLAPGWKPTRSSSGPVAVNSNGSYLHLKCRVDGGEWENPKASSSWRFPNWGSREKAWDLSCRASGRQVQIETVAVVSTSRKILPATFAVAADARPGASFTR